LSTWHDIPGVFSMEVQSIHSVLFGRCILCDLEGYEIPPLRSVTAEPGDYELVIEFVSSGTYQPASMYGGADRLGWPEERSEDRELVRAYLLDWKTEIELPLEVQRQLFQAYLREIYAAELKGDE